MYVLRSHTHTHNLDFGTTKQIGRTSPADGQARCALDCEKGIALQSWSLNRHMFEAGTQVRCVKAVQMNRIIFVHVKHNVDAWMDKRIKGQSDG